MRAYLSRDFAGSALMGFYWAFLLYLMVPLALMAVMSFKQGGFIGFPVESWTLDWYVQAASDKQFLEAFGYSVFIAVVVTAISTVIGIWIALAIAAEGVWGRSALYALALLPAVVPGLISAISLRIFIGIFDLQTGTAAVIFGHTVHAVPFMVVMVLTRLRSMPGNLIDAARDLGADSFVAFCRVTIPFLAPALVGGMIFCCLTSFDDFVRTFFLDFFRASQYWPSGRIDSESLSD